MNFRRYGLTALTVLLGAATTAGCRTLAPAPHGSTQGVFWDQLQALCGGAFAGRLVEGSAADSVMRREALVMHVRSCSPTELRIPFHVGGDRSRTWVVTRTPDGLRLKHDHRHADGTPDSITQYGGDTRGPGSATTQDFYADAFTAALLPVARTNVWTVEVVPGEKFAYALRREGTDRRIRVEFDLRTAIAAPPPPWGSNDSAPDHEQSGNH